MKFCFRSAKSVAADGSGVSVCAERETFALANAAARTGHMDLSWFLPQDAESRRADRVGSRYGAACDSGERTARESQATRLSKVTDKAYFARRLRARAGTVVTPGSHFSLTPRDDLGRLAFRRDYGLGMRFTPGQLHVRLAG